MKLLLALSLLAVLGHSLPMGDQLKERTSKVEFAGINIAGFEMSCTIDGYCPLSEIIPPLSQYSGIDGDGQMKHFVTDDGLNAFRLPVSWQYLVNNVLGGLLNSINFEKYNELVQACLDAGASLCIIDIHNYARWNGGIIGQGGPTNAQFSNLWSQLASKYASQPKIAFGIMNEPHDLPSTSMWADTVQAAVTAIRNSGATGQMILLPGNDWTTPDSFVNGSGSALNKVTNLDGSKTNLIMDVHKYLDSDNSGTHSECVTNNIDDSFSPLATWLRANGRQAFNSETGGGNTASCVSYMCQQLAYLDSNSDVYIGYTSWAAGSFSTSYLLSEVPTYANGVWTDTTLVKSCIVPEA